MSYGGIPEEKNQDATVFVGELATEVSETVLWELMLQAGPVVSVNIPRDKISSAHSGFGFVEFASERDADYAIRVMNGIKLYGKQIRVSKSNTARRMVDVGANLFIGNLDASVDERVLSDTFSAFGPLISPPKVMRDETGMSKGYAFIGYDSFTSSDAAIEAMNGAYLANKPISVVYAYRKDNKGERHGSESERLLAEKQRVTLSQQQQQVPPPQQQQPPQPIQQINPLIGGTQMMIPQMPMSMSFQNVGYPTMLPQFGFVQPPPGVFQTQQQF